jgi:hypothetical protein
MIRLWSSLMTPGEPQVEFEEILILAQKPLFTYPDKHMT